MMEKLEFLRIMKLLQRDAEQAEKLDIIFQDNDFISGAAFMNTELAAATITLLDQSFENNDDWVSYFVYELDFGKKWKPDTIQFKGKSISLQTAEDLWDLLKELQIDE